ncbi:hypothetical protein [Pedobacter nutrimenti]|uniref:hypothetical protein n=1 Tax=Pedobacter nutrimenti TaxID=1241337 RepID=UPI00292D2651|nr:hypothetical protein [Pedobacter nutrimenti]
MLKTRLFILIALLIGSTLGVAILYGATEYMAKSPNAFIRKIPPFPITADNVKDLKNGQLYFAGQNGNYFYLGNRYIKNLLFQVDLKTLDTQKVLLKAPRNFKPLEDAYVEIDSSNLFLIDGIKAKISTGSTTDYTLTQDIVGPYFSAAVPLSVNSFLFRSIGGNNVNVLGKQQVRGMTFVREDLLKKQIDGVFCTDGIFLQVPKYNKVFYIYHYRNQFLSLDTNLSLLYKGKTIDTNSLAKIKVGRIKSSNQVTMASPPLLVNKQACANKDYLFIRSALKADNETDDMHDKATAIDVYSANDGKYKLSFYLPEFAGEKLTDFKVYDKMLVALFGHYIYTFKLNF